MMTYPNGFDAADYGDRTHLTVSGGRKLAAMVAIMSGRLPWSAATGQHLESMKNLQTLFSYLPPWLATLAGHALSLAVAVLTAVVLHHVLYRIDIPGKPFIHVAF